MAICGRLAAEKLPIGRLHNASAANLARACCDSFLAQGPDQPRRSRTQPRSYKSARSRSLQDPFLMRDSRLRSSLLHRESRRTLHAVLIVANLKSN